MSSIKRRLGMLAVAAGAGLAAIAGTGAAAHAGTLPHHITPTITLTATSNDLPDGSNPGGVETFKPGTFTMNADSAYEWDYTWCFGGYPGGNVERIDVGLHVTTDSSDNLTTWEAASATVGPRACSGNGYFDSSATWGQDYDGTGEFVSSLGFVDDHYKSSLGLEVYGYATAVVQDQRY